MTVLPPFAYLAATLLQAPQAVVTGTIRDQETGAPIAGAAVVLSDLSRGTTADSGGHYLLTGVPPGPNTSSSATSATPRVWSTRWSRARAGSRSTSTLRATPVRLATIVARPSVAVRGLEEAAVAYPDRAASLAAIRSDPLLAEPDALGALGGGEVVLAPESPNGLHVRGGSRGPDRVRAGRRAGAEPLPLGRPVQRVEPRRARRRQPCGRRACRTVTATRSRARWPARPVRRAPSSTSRARSPPRRGGSRWPGRFASDAPAFS